MALTQKKKENEKKRLQKRREKEERKAYNKENNLKGKPLEEMFAYVDEFGNLSDTPPEDKVETKKSSSIVPTASVEFSNGVVTYYNVIEKYGFIKNEVTRESVYFNFKILGFELSQGQHVKFKYQKAKQGLKVVEVLRN